MVSLAIRVIMSESYEQAVEKTIAALKAEGFGVLTRIDVKATLKEKLGEEFRPYVILGACNPPLAHRALSAEPLVGVMLPCNVTVEQHEQGALVSILNPEMMMGIADLGENPHLREVAGEARTRLERVAAALGQVVEG